MWVKFCNDSVTKYLHDDSSVKVGDDDGDDDGCDDGCDDGFDDNDDVDNDSEDNDDDNDGNGILDINVNIKRKVKNI